MIDRFEDFSFAITRLSRYWNKLAGEVMEQYGLKGPYALYLTTLYRFSEGMTAARLAEYCGKDKADISRAMAALEKKGYVKKDASGGTYRALLTLTNTGRQLTEIIFEKAGKAVEFGGQNLTDQQRKIFYDALDSIVANLQILSEQGL